MWVAYVERCGSNPPILFFSGSVQQKAHAAEPSMFSIFFATSLHGVEAPRRKGYAILNRGIVCLAGARAAARLWAPPSRPRTPPRTSRRAATVRFHRAPECP